MVNQTRRTSRRFTTHRASRAEVLRVAHGLGVPAPAAVDRLAALCVAWQALRLWSNPMRAGYQSVPKYVATFTRWMEEAARA